MADEKEARERRLAEALRANLHRRKGQLRARDTLRDSGEDAGAPAPQSVTQPHDRESDRPASDSPVTGPDAAARETHGQG